MNLQAIYFCGNDKERLLFSLEAFKRHHPDVDTLIVNNGDKNLDEVLKFPNTYLKVVPNIWHKKTHCGVGSFGPEYFDILFEWAIRDDFKHTHTLYMETDVFTTRRVAIEPRYDMAGPVHPCGHTETFLYDKMGIETLKFHAGCGGTVFSKNFFTKVRQANYHLFRQLFEEHPEHYYMDMIGFLVGRDAGCTFGNWEESSDVKDRFVLDRNGNYVATIGYKNVTFLHNYKLVP